MRMMDMGKDCLPPLSGRNSGHVHCFFRRGEQFQAGAPLPIVKGGPVGRREAGMPLDNRQRSANRNRTGKSA